MQDWKKRLVRDLTAFGSWPFYIIVLARSLIGPYWEFFIPTIIAGIVIAPLEYFKDKFDLYSARLIALAYFTIVFYNTTSYTIFAIALGLLVLLSSYFVHRSSKKSFLGIVAGILSVAIGIVGYYLLGFL